MVPNYLFYILATDTCDKSGSFLGLIPWYHYLPNPSLQANGDCSIRTFNFLSTSGHPSDIPLVLLAVVDDLLRIAGLVAVGFIIYGAFQYVGSQGNPEHTSKAQGTIINALIGLVIAIASVAFVGFLGNKLGGS
jgi:hypothetical protein